jgi:SAM-dependent methyltransferase
VKIPELRDIVPWGRSLAEYVQMFRLTAGDLERRLLDCGGGPASFAAEAAAHGRRVTAVDPIYRFSAAEIAKRVEEVAPAMVAGMEAERERFVWKDGDTPQRHGDRRLAAMRQFLDDYANGLVEGRYVVGAVPHLPFADGVFDLALSSHFLFLYSTHLSFVDHLAAIEDMLRVSEEVRVFPVLDLAGDRSIHLDPVIDELQAQGFVAHLVGVDYEFQRGGNQMLVVERPRS